MEKAKLDFLTAKARKLRDDAIEIIGHFGVGHIGGTMSVMDALTVIYYDKAKDNIDPKNPAKQDRDRVIMSKGHAGPAMYAVLADLGYYPKEWMSTLNKNGTNLPSHCDMNKTPGIDFTAGSLGQGLSAAVGMALAAKIDNNPATIYCFIGDGESQEGQIWEASMFAGNKGLDNLIVFLDNNKMQLDGPTDSINSLKSAAAKWEAFGFFTQEIDGHNLEASADAIDAAKAQKGKPAMIVLNTVKGHGASFTEGVANCHSMSIPEEVWRKETGRYE
ncbi:MAG: transketolase [Clostridia bacterium]|nr:transketolase [Clostridia bacterium]